MHSEKDFNADGLVHFLKTDADSRTLLQQAFGTMTARTATDPNFHAWEFLNVFVMLRSRALVMAARSSTPPWKAFPHSVRCDVTDMLYNEWKSLKEEK